MHYYATKLDFFTILEYIRILYYIDVFQYKLVNWKRYGYIFLDISLKKKANLNCQAGHNMQGLAQTDPETWLADQWFAQTIHRLVFQDLQDIGFYHEPSRCFCDAPV